MKNLKGEVMSSVIKEFSRFAHQYNKHNIVQAEVAKALIKKLPLKKYSNIIDLGCGSGEVYKNLQEQAVEFSSFTALDSAQSMLNMHPSEKNISKVCIDFNDADFLKHLPLRNYDLLLSSSALQWSKDLNFTLSAIATLSKSAYFAVFTSATFKALHKTANVKSPIHTKEEIQESILNHYDDVSFELENYTLDFNSVREMFSYIKQSGVSSGEKKLGYSETRRLMLEYPLDYLEFEVLFVEAKIKA